MDMAGWQEQMSPSGAVPETLTGQIMDVVASGSAIGFLSIYYVFTAISLFYFNSSQTNKVFATNLSCYSQILWYNAICTEMLCKRVSRKLIIITAFLVDASTDLSGRRLFSFILLLLFLLYLL